MFMSICAFSLMDLIVKWSVDYPIGQVLFFRGFFGIIFYFSLAILLLSFLTIPQGWIMPTLNHFILLSLIGIFGGAANLWLSQSYKFSEVSLVTPLKYLALVFAIIFGYFIWDEIPTYKTLVGALLVIVSTLIIFRREIYKKKVITSKTIND